MQYFALLISRERDRTPEEGAAEMAAYQGFHAKAASAIRGGDALLPAATAVRITGGPGRAGDHRRPVRRRRRSGGRLLRVRGRKPRRGTGFGPRHPGGQVRRRRGLADVPLRSSPSRNAHRQRLARAAAGAARTRTTHRAHRSGRRWLGAPRQQFGAAAGDHIIGGAGLAPPSTATTVRVRDGEVAHHGRTVRGRRRSRQRLLRAWRRRPRRGRQAGVDDPGFRPCSCGSWRGSRGCRSANDQTWTASSAGSGAPPSPRSRGGPATSPSPRTPSRKPAPRRCAPGRATVCPISPGGWLVTVARNRARDRLRRESVRPGKELAAVSRQTIRARTDHTDPHPVRRRRAADDVHLCAPGARPAVAAGAHAAVGVGV